MQRPIRAPSAGGRASGFKWGQLARFEVGERDRHVLTEAESRRVVELRVGIGSDLFLRLNVKQLRSRARTDHGDLDPVKTTLGVATKTPKWIDETRIVPGDPDASLLVHLVETRERGQQMPPIGSAVVDHEGSARSASGSVR